MMARNLASGNSSTGPTPSTPALLTSTSIGPLLRIVAMAPFTDASESTSIVVTVIGRFSRAAVSANAGDCDGLRMVAWTSWPARAKASAVSKPIPLLVPVISTDAICSSLVTTGGGCLAPIPAHQAYRSRLYMRDIAGLFLRSVTCALEYAEMLAPRADCFAILVGHESGYLMEMGTLASAN